MSAAHLGESAELYALGVLDETQRAAVDAHVKACSECARRLGEAEETVLELERRLPASDIPFGGRNLSFVRRGIAPWWIAVAAAAAFAVALLVPRVFVRDDAQLAMISSHFSHAQFTGNGPPAKLIYARDRSWYYVLVAGGGTLSVVGINGQAATILGTTNVHGKTSDFFARNAGRFDRIELRDGARIVEAAPVR